MTRMWLHTDSIKLTELPDEIAGCTDCFTIGGTWLHLRMCQSCGHIACFDSSPHRHASAHARSSAHPIVRSLEPAEDWSWCYLERRGRGRPRADREQERPGALSATGREAVLALRLCRLTRPRVGVR
jgi:hypothetical protein